MERTQASYVKKKKRDQLREQEKSTQYTHHSFTPPPTPNALIGKKAGTKKICKTEYKEATTTSGLFILHTRDPFHFESTVVVTIHTHTPFPLCSDEVLHDYVMRKWRRRCSSWRRSSTLCVWELWNWMGSMSGVAAMSSARDSSRDRRLPGFGDGTGVAAQAVVLMSGGAARREEYSTAGVAVRRGLDTSVTSPDLVMITSRRPSVPPLRTPNFPGRGRANMHWNWYWPGPGKRLSERGGRLTSSRVDPPNVETGRPSTVLALMLRWCSRGPVLNILQGVQMRGQASSCVILSSRVSARVS